MYKRGNNSLNSVLKLHSLDKCYGSECSAGKDQQVLPVLEEFTGFPHPKVFCLLLLTCQINESLWASAKSPMNWVPFKTNSFLCTSYKSWVNLTFSISNTWGCRSIPSNIHLRSFSRDNPHHFLSKALMWCFVVVVNVEFVVCCLLLLMLSLLFVVVVFALKSLIERIIFAPRGIFCICQEPTNMWNDDVLFKSGNQQMHQAQVFVFWKHWLCVYI